MDYRSFLSHVHVDVCQQVKECFIFPNQSYALKDLASFLGYKFKYPELCGLLVALEYHRHIQDKTPLDPRLFEYNEDDVKALPFIIEKLRSLDQAKQTSSIAELAISEKQKAFREFVEKLRGQGVTGSQYREKIAEWNRDHQ
jgi:predicted RecB family nuclease